MDPFSIGAGCVGILGAIVKTSSTIRQLVRDVRGARDQLSITAQQLTALELTINSIEDDHNAEGGIAIDQQCLPDALADASFHTPTERGLEGKFRDRLEALRAARRSARAGDSEV